MAQQDAVIRLLLVEDRLEDAEQLISHLRNGGMAVRPQRPESEEELVSLLGSQSVDMVLASFEAKYLPLETVVQHVNATGKDIPVIALADAVGSTSGILKAAREFDAPEYIVATDKGMLHMLRQQNPGKLFIEAPTAGNSATCKSCAHCPWMAMNGLAGVAQILEKGLNEIHVDSALIPRARQPIDRMLAFTGAQRSGQNPGALVPNIGAA